MKKEPETSGWSYILLALLTLAGLGLEIILAFALEPALYGAPISGWSTTQNILHWCMTCMLWGVTAYLLIRFAKIKLHFDLFAKGSPLQKWQLYAIAACIIFSLAVSYVDWNGSKIIKEFKYNGALKFAFQYLYYIFETALVSLIIIFAQKAFEKWFRRENIPYGGIICALTWGLGHMLTKGSLLAGILCAIGGFVYGVIYLLTNRDIRKCYPILFICFVL